MSIDPDTIIQIIAKEKGILLSKDDPVLGFLAVHDACIDSYAQKLGAAVSEVNERLELVTDKHYREASKLVEKAIQESVSTLKTEQDAIVSTLKSVVEESADRYRLALEERFQQAEEATSKAQFAMQASIAFAVLSLLAAVIIVFL